MIFLFSNFLELPDHYFEGYAFVGVDYISGADGAQAYLKETGRFVDPGQDGCYLSIQKTQGFHRIGVDFCGNKKIFYYCDGENWGVSNSIVELTRHLSENGVILRANLAQLESLNISSTLTSQISCFATLIHGIRLLPTYCEIRVSMKEFRVETRPISPILDYKEALSQFVNTWVRRFETLVVNPALRITCDLTGGRDSRLVFSFLQRALQRLGGDARAKITVRSGEDKRWAADYKAAKRIAKHYGIVLNKALPVSTSKRIVRTRKEVYDSWFQLNVGVYFPIYFPSNSADDLAIQLHGGGGGNHRLVYPWSDPDGFLQEYVFQRKTTREMHAWADEFRSTYMMLSSRMPNVPFSMLHYREFRGRMHGGRAPQYRVVLSPLSGRHMEDMSNFQEKAISAQIYFDTMESLMPGIIDFPYDEASKAPTFENHENLTIIDIGTQAEPGNCYFSVAGQYETKEVAGDTPLRQLIAGFERASTDEVRCLLPQVSVKAQHAISEAAKLGKFDHASYGKVISRVFAAKFALDYL